MDQTFCDVVLLKFYVAVEVALAKAEARVGVIPVAAAEIIADRAPAVVLDIQRLRQESMVVGYPVLPLVRQLAEGVGEAGEYLHWGATTQDIMDTGVVLQLRDALNQVETDLSAIASRLAQIAEAHRDTPMAGRTHLQHAAPVTFGYKAAVWLSMIDRHLQRLEQLRERALVVQFSGAAGTLASLGDKGLAVQHELALELSLNVPDITWHTARDNLVEVVQFLALVAGSLGKIGYDVMLLMSTEVGEVFEPFVPFRGASSTMPQKRNPISSELLVAVAKAARAQCDLMLDALVQDFERATGPWHVEWLALPETFKLTASALHHADSMLDGLEVDVKRMRSNLDMTSGQILAEAVMMQLAPHLGRQTSHDLVYAACRKAADSNRPLGAILAETPAVTEHLDPARIEAVMDPTKYLGAASQMVDRLLANRQQNPKRNPS